ncbi:hypothetical protein THRCLA_20205 [Thraustotheca clavata]|uniref:Uncharacterized protein n=1 Tax=Thraustotheca clavata TaxID=74557 RepID=A0A1W0AA34_9STRA|nr:hypothetical protein THRCLA_20205 [Thraustotheca clavata]
MSKVGPLLIGKVQETTCKYKVHWNKLSILAFSCFSTFNKIVIVAIESLFVRGITMNTPTIQTTIKSFFY